MKKKLPRIQRREVQVSSQGLVQKKPLFGTGELPLLVEPAMPGIRLVDWLADHRSDVEQDLLKHGGLLFRGFGLSEPSDLEEVVEAVSGTSLEYKERSSPRSQVHGNIYTSTDYPSSYPIFLHNENSYQKAWPMRIFFFARIVADSGGETPIADCRRVYARIREETRQTFSEKGWMVVRNFGGGVGLDWKEVFQSDDREQVEEYCRENGIEAEWREDGRLRTRAVRRACARHPRTQEWTWFNHATFFHVSTLEPSIREAMMKEFAEEDLPSNTYYGDGSPIEPGVLAELRAAYAEETVSFPWQKGDLLLLDNMLVAHGRAPYTGNRQVLVGMSQPMSWQGLG